MSSSSSSPSTPCSSVPSSPSTSATDDVHLKEISEQDRARAAAIKAEANAAFTEHNFARAADLYTQAIELNPTDSTYFCNRAFARMKIEEYGYALGDCTKAIELNPSYAKAYFRRALCSVQILRLPAAIADFKRAISLDPKSAASITTQLKETQRLHRKIEFEKAIEIEEEKDAAVRCKEIISEGGCMLDASYDGPKLATEDGKTFSPTIEFVSDLLQWYKAGKSLPRRYVWEIVLGAYGAFSQEESMVDVTLEEGMSCDVIGDVHGQYYDFLHLLSLTGLPSEKHCLLMNGDLVDRGSWSIEVIVTAFALKWLFPTRMFINRGNHETKDMNRAYGFEGEAKHKHGEQTYKLFAHVFTALPLSTLISATLPPVPTASPSKVILGPNGTKRFFVVHGGLFSRDGVTLDEIRALPRIGKQPGQEGLMCELLWTDPQDMPGRGPSKRGVGIAFGPDVTKRWCEDNKITAVFRSHEVRQDGYAVEHDGLCVTVFSAPNYVDQSGNKAAFVRVDAAGTCDYRQFDAVEHPPMRPMAYSQGGLAGLMM